MIKSRIGFTLIELLAVIAVLAILLAIAAPNLSRLRAQMRMDQAAQLVAQELQACRSLSLGESRICRWRVTTTGFVLERYAEDEDDPNVLGAFCSVSEGFDPVRNRQLPRPVRFENLAPGDCVAFDTRGFAHFGGGTPGQIKLSDGTLRRTIVPSLVGAIRVVR